MVFTAHISEDKRRKQTVYEHCTSTSELAAGYASSFGAENIGRLQGFLHDIGKLCVSFDDYINERSKARRGEIDHSYAGAKYISEMADEIDPKRLHNVSRLIGRTIVSHHGLHDWVDDEGNDYFAVRTDKTDNYNEVRKNTDELFDREYLKDLLEKAADEYRILREKIRGISSDNTDFSFYLGLLERMLESVLIDADRVDTADFMAGRQTSEKTASNELWEEMRGRMDDKLAKFSGRTDKISLRRRKISDRCAAFAENDVHVCRMVVPTGGGKTLSSLRFAIEYCIRHGMERIVYMAPFMSILEQNSMDMRSVAGEENFIEHHSNALADMLDKENNAEELAAYELHTERWDLPSLAVTMVQFLNSLFLAGSSAVRRMHRLSRAVIIVDEVQSVPIKCVNMFNMAVNFLSRICGAAVVLCSATQPVMNETAYPIIMDEKCSMTGDFAEDFEVFRRVDIISEADAYGMSYDEAAEYSCGRFEEAGNLLIIVNTKSAALAMYERIREMTDAEVIHLSTNMCPEHRRRKISEMKKLLADKKPLICVTTQLIEAGVDISFRCVIRSLAGLDNAVQAAGRCNRNGESAEPCRTYMIRLKEENLGSLRDIKDAQMILQSMFDADKNADWQSDAVISDYFRRLYLMESGKLSYPVKDGMHGTSLVGLLSLDKDRYDISPKTSGRFSSQAFKTAGTLFEVIDSRTADVIVPYNDDAEKLIDSLRNGTADIGKALRTAQKYMVGIYSNAERKLGENNGIYRLECGAVILEKTFYDDVFGVKLEGAEQENLIF